MTLDPFFKPSSVAIIGASNKTDTIGYVLMNNLIKSGFQGEIFPINIRGEDFFGRKVYKSVLEVTSNIDLAVIAIPARVVPKVIDECGKKNVKGVIVISAGFKEAGEDGAKLEQEIIEITQKYGMRLQGPNCLGIINTHHPIDLSFASALPKKGSLGFITQSGALGTAVLDWIIREEIGFGSIVSLGNKADLDEVDFIEAMLEDDNIKIILLYLESIERGREFIKISERAVTKKPVIIVKGGTSSAGAKAAGSHTGALVGSFLAYEKAFDKAGVIFTDSMEDLFNYAIAFSDQTIPSDEGVAIVTNAGGPGILATDLIINLGMKLSELTDNTINNLEKALPSAASTGNPIDILGDALSDRYELAIEYALKDPNVNSLIVLLTPQAMTDSDNVATKIVTLSKKYPEKPLISVFMGGERVYNACKYLKDNDIPCYSFPEKGIRALNALYNYSRFIKLPKLNPPNYDEVDLQRIKSIFKKVREDGRTLLLPHEAVEVAEVYGIEAPASKLATNADEAVQHAEEIGYPVVMKIVSPEILHKTDIGGVELNLTSSTMVRIAFEEIMRKARRSNPLAKIYGITVDKMVPRGREMIIGMSRDPQFGPMVMFGLGGIYVNFLKDVSFRLAPLNERDAQEMMEETKSYALLEGVRGEARADINALRDVLIRVGHFVWNFPEVAELDINPILVYEEGKGCSALDLKITLY